MRVRVLGAGAGCGVRRAVLSVFYAIVDALDSADATATNELGVKTMAPKTGLSVFSSNIVP